MCLSGEPAHSPDEVLIGPAHAGDRVEHLQASRSAELVLHFEPELHTREHLVAWCSQGAERVASCEL